MQIGVIGLGRMGSNISRRLMKAGHHCVVFDVNADARNALAKEGAKAAGSLAEAVRALREKPRAVWVMLPAGRITEETVESLGSLLEPDDIIIDGGNSFYKDDIRRAKRLAEKRIRYVSAVHRACARRPAGRGRCRRKPARSADGGNLVSTRVRSLAPTLAPWRRTPCSARLRSSASRTSASRR